MTRALATIEPVLPPLSFSPARTAGTTEQEKAHLAERVREWLVNVTAPSRKRRCTYFVLLHSTGTAESTARDAQTTEDVGTELDEPGRLDACARVASSMVRAAWTVADTLSGSQLFYIAGYKNDNPKATALDQCPLRLTAPRDPNAGLNDAPAADASSTLALALRYAEASHRMALESQHKLTATMHDLVQTLSDQNAALQENHTKLREITENALDRSVTRQLDAYAGKLKTDREERFYLTAEKVIPKILERWGLGPMGQLIRTLNADQKKALVGWALSLPKEQRDLALGALDSHLELGLLEAAQKSEENVAIVVQSEESKT